MRARRGVWGFSETEHRRNSMRGFPSRVVTLAFAALLLVVPRAIAQIVVSANDNKVANVDGRTIVADNPSPDTVTIINMNVSPPRIIGEGKATAAVAGPPNSVAVAPDER